MTTIDAELIAKLVEGRATPGERALILKQADESPEVLALIADTAVIYPVVDSAPYGQSAMADLTARRRRRPSPAMLSAVAAGLIVAISLPNMIRQRSVPAFQLQALEGPGLGSRAAEGAGGTTRGAVGGSRRERSAQIGARVADYMILAQTTDAQAPVVAGEIAAMLRALPGGAAAAARFETLTQRATPEQQREAVAATEAMLDGQRFRAGAWMETVRLAAQTQSVSMMQRAELLTAIERIARNKDFPSGAREAAERVREGASRAQPEWVAILGDAKVFFAEVGR